MLTYIHILSPLFSPFSFETSPPPLFSSPPFLHVLLPPLCLVIFFVSLFAFSHLFCLLSQFSPKVTAHFVAVFSRLLLQNHDFFYDFFNKLTLAQQQQQQQQHALVLLVDSWLAKVRAFLSSSPLLLSCVPCLSLSVLPLLSSPSLLPLFAGSLPRTAKFRASVSLRTVYAHTFTSAAGNFSLVFAFFLFFLHQHPSARASFPPSSVFASSSLLTHVSQHNTTPKEDLTPCPLLALLPDLLLIISPLSFLLLLAVVSSAPVGSFYSADTPQHTARRGQRQQHCRSRSLRPARLHLS